SVTAVQWKPPTTFFNGYIEFTVQGGTETRSRFGAQSQDAMNNENAVVVAVRHLEAFEYLRGAIDRALLSRNQPQQQPWPPIPAAAPKPDPIDQLRRLGELRDAGVVTPDEFEAKKAEMLRRL
ncbi:MAG: hypothetical protein EOL89_06830, partial [Actinobacteria bacterium]|nr:hypothetical protein [Actinomycetota bacterium]